MISPRVAPTKKRGIMNPPLQPEVTVMEIAIILNIKIKNKNFIE
jgi:hypothetical protein